MRTLVDAALSGERRAIARLISLVEDGGQVLRRLIPLIYPHTGQAHLIGVTGAPGSGKSTLVSQIALEYRRRGMSVGIVAVDPSSPFSGGAILGDRIRMGALSGDDGVFVRSMGSRGSLGGLAAGTTNVARVLDACGYERILVETVGAGQSEVEIADAAHTTLVIQGPGMGDDIQTMKAGILEIADILVVNKADLDGARRAVSQLEAMLMLGHRHEDDSFGYWQRPIVQTVATKGTGTAELVDAIENHATFLSETGRDRELGLDRAEDELVSILQNELLTDALERLGPADLREAVESVCAREVDPYTAAHTLLERLGVPALSHRGLG